MQRALSQTKSPARSQEGHHCYMPYAPDRYLEHTLQATTYSAESYLGDRKTEESMVITQSQALHLLRLRGYIIKDDIPSHLAPA
jgi:hypothetical protein